MHKTTGAYTIDYYDQHERIINNSEPRIPICFCVDNSGSMRDLVNPPNEFNVSGQKEYLDGEAIRRVQMKPGFIEKNRLTELKNVIKRMLHRMVAMPELKNIVACNIVTFSQFANCALEFTDISYISDQTIDKIKFGRNQTNSARGIKMALSRLDQYTYEIKKAGNDGFCPVFIILSDGKPTDKGNANQAAYEVRNRAQNGLLTVIPIAIGENLANIDWLQQLSPDRHVYQMQYDYEFEAVFNLITQKVRMTATTLTADEKLKTSANLYSEDQTHDDLSAQYGENLLDTLSADQMEDMMQNAFSEIFNGKIIQ